MNAYSKRITAIAPLHDARHIEAMMRVEHSTLDGLSEQQFRDEVLFCVQCVDQAGLDQSERIARSFGL